MITLSKEQQSVHDDVVVWVNNYYNRSSNNRSWISVAGLAGTGKTTLIKFITKTLVAQKDYYNIAFVTYTGKASVVLKNKLGSLSEQYYVGTIHSLIYKPIIDEYGKITGWMLKPYIDQDLIVVDEGSMVGKELWNHLLSYGKPIIVVGDHGQLPPIGSTNFSLMKEPDLILKEIHRQALENPIIKLSLYARKYGSVPTKIFGREAAKIDWILPSAKNALYNYKVGDDTQILCGMNKTRVTLNKILRQKNNFERKEPCIGEKIICLMNNKDDFVMNGQSGYINEITLREKFLYDINMNVDGDNFERNLIVYTGGFHKEKYDVVMDEIIHDKVKRECTPGKKINVFDYGYAISVHKSQGSEWDKVILVEERNFYQSDEDYARWLYTGITRAKNKLLIIKNFDGR